MTAATTTRPGPLQAIHERMGPVSRFAVYLSGILLARWTASVFAAISLVALLDTLANAPEVAKAAERAGLGGPTAYLMQRIPIIFDRMLLIAILLAIILTYASLVRRREIVALGAAGLSSTKQALILAPVTLLVGIMSILVVDTVMPPAVRALQSWGAPGYAETRLSEDEPLWLADDGRVVRITGRTAPQTFTGLSLYDLADNGVVTGITTAGSATFTRGDGWTLDGAESFTAIPGTPAPAATWDSRQTPGTLDRIISSPRDLSLYDMGRLRRLRGSGSNPAFAYDAWSLHRLTRPLAAVVLLFACVPIMQRLGRQDSGELAMVKCLVAGFSYLILDGVMLSFAESGVAKPAWAVMLPIGLFALLALYLNLLKERTR